AQKDTTICFGQNATLNGSGGVTYKWTPSNNLSDQDIKNPTVIKPAVTTVYSLQVTDNNGCKSLNDAKVTVIVTPPAKLFAGNDTSVITNEPFLLKAIDVNNSGFINYSWYPSSGLNNSFIQSPVAILNNGITYTVTATTEKGCEASDDIIIKVFRVADIFVPSAFTPNNDGRNDLLKAIPVGIKSFKYFIVYDRWGHKVFSTSDASQGWDGRTGGIIHETSTFVWITEGVDFKNNKVMRKGIVTLIR
ncbi:MAG: gliding motility-associated C-terminal domain-containing protein, partial [Chitinophagaceae bacterium]|nr:gliding motility-associated C-terminal domain-containing protein [Chitinophagaceae bacterium]